MTVDVAIKVTDFLAGERTLRTQTPHGTIRGRFCDPELLERLKGWLTHRGLVLNEKKTRLVDIRQEGIKFLGFALTWRRGRRGWNYPHVEPHPKSLKKLRDGIREKLNRGTHWRSVEEVIPELNRRLKGWKGVLSLRE